MVTRKLDTTSEPVTWNGYWALIKNLTGMLRVGDQIIIDFEVDHSNLVV
ncbi:hypothetical protein [Aquisalimonas sp.]|nr:hypothetical protein [Aquisalimonas sp.]